MLKWQFQVLESKHATALQLFHLPTPSFMGRQSFPKRKKENNNLTGELPSKCWLIKFRASASLTKILYVYGSLVN